MSGIDVAEQVSLPGNLIDASEICRRNPGGGGWLLDHVSLTVPPGAKLGLMGPSGSGKTLLLRALALLDPVDAGEIRFEGQPIERRRIPYYRSQVIYLHQSPRLLADVVEQALRRPFELSLHRQRRFNPERILTYLQALGSKPSFLKKPVRELSGGEIQMVALMRDSTRSMYLVAR